MPVSEPVYEFQVERNVATPVRDGTTLRADVYRPRAQGRYPVLVGRVGYKLRDWPMDFYTPMGEYYAQRGYVVVWQNVRGTFASQGRFHPFWDDAWGANRDGYDTVEWAATQPWSNGKVMYGRTGGLCGSAMESFARAIGTPWSGRNGWFRGSCTALRWICGPQHRYFGLGIACGFR
jgi:hypothetical protein